MMSEDENEKQSKEELVLGHVTAVLVPDDLPYNLVMLHLELEIRRRRVVEMIGTEGFMRN